MTDKINESQKQWERKDFIRGMADYYGSGEYWKDIANTAEKMSILHRLYKLSKEYGQDISELYKIFSTIKIKEDVEILLLEITKTEKRIANKKLKKARVDWKIKKAGMEKLKKHKEVHP